MTDEAPALDLNGPVGRPFRPFPPDDVGTTPFERFREMAEAHPDREAIRCGRQRTTYGTLMDQVRRIGWALAREGETGPVALALPTDARFPAAMLGALAAGRPYVPLDLSHPPERLDHILTHSGAARVLVAGTAPGGWAGRVGAGRLLTDLDALDAPPEGWRPTPRAEDTAYILYTSGSMGRPKGVYQDQRGLIHDVMQYTHSVHLSTEDTTTLLYSPSVNGAIRDIFGALLNGARLCVCDLRSDGLREAWERMADAQVTLFHAMPPVLRTLLRASPGTPLPGSIRLAYVAGDRFHPGDAALLRSALPEDALLYTGIGSTECATLYRQWFVPRDWPTETAVLPVGHAIPDRELLLVDDDGRPVEAGEAGNIEVRSRFLARGYWNDPELTAASFRPEAGDGPRTFRTGDRGRLRADGLLEFHGRVDRQAKVRGYRVEPVEVESAMRSIPGIQDAGACVVEESGEARLEARVVAVAEASPGARLEPSAILAALTGRLPSHLLPQRILVVPSLPRLANFKIDAMRLRELAIEALGSADHAVPQDLGGRDVPVDSDSLAGLVAEEWGRLLRRPPESPDQRWDHAGGDSLQALELMVALERRLGRALGSGLVTAGASPRSIALGVASERPTDATAPGVGQRLRGRLFITGPATGMTVHDRALAERLGTLLPVELLAGTSLEEEMERVHSVRDQAVRHLDTIRRMAEPSEPIYLLGISFGGRVAFELACLLAGQGFQVAFVAVTDIRPTYGYNRLSRVAWMAWCDQASGQPAWERLRRRARAEARIAASRCIQFLATRGWMTSLRLVVRSGLLCFGQNFAPGSKAAISQSQIAGWRPPWYRGELLLVVTEDTRQLFQELPETLGWEAHAEQVRVVQIPGQHSSYNVPPHAEGYARILADELRRAAGMGSGYWRHPGR